MSTPETNNGKHDLTQGPVSEHILRMTPPMAGGFFSMMAFNLIDTWYVSKLGTDALAAMGFTFPVVMVLFSVAMGIGLGTSSGISRAIGAGDHHRVKRLTTDSLHLTFLTFLILGATGLATMDILFPLLGAPSELLPMVKAYMTIWFMATPLTVLPMIGNNALRATGNTLTPAIIMGGAAILNGILDPILIFGLFGCPQMGIVGAAQATVLSRLLSLLASLFLLYRSDMLINPLRGFSTMFASWATILHIAIPAAATNLLQPLTSGIITRMLANFGKEAVAATSAGQRVEMFIYLVPMSMGTVLVPLIGQNWGAGQHQRVRHAWNQTNRFGIYYSLGCLAIIFPFAGTIGNWFSQDPDVVTLVATYLRIAMIGSIMLHILVHTGFAFNAAGEPAKASVLNILRLIGLVLPLAWIGAQIGSVPGLYTGIAAAHLIGGTLALIWFNHFLKKHLPNQTLHPSR